MRDAHPQAFVPMRSEYCQQAMLSVAHCGDAVVSLTRVVVALLALLVIGSIAFLWFSPYLTGEDDLKDFFLHQLEQNLGHKIDVHRVKLVLFPTIRLEMT